MDKKITKDNKSFNLPTNWDEYDLAYEYVQVAIKSLYLEEHLKNDLAKVVKNYFLNTKNKPNLEKINLMLYENTKNYLILAGKFNELEKLNTTLEINEKISFYLDIITNALLKARESNKYIIEIQFSILDWLIYANWFLNDNKKALINLEKILSCSFKYPNVSFEEQHEICCKTAMKIQNDKTNEKNCIILLKNIYKNFIFNLKVMAKWEKLWNKIKSNHSENLKNKILEWILIHYLLPLYISINGYNDFDEEFKQISKKLYDYEIDNEVLIDVIKLLLETSKLVNKFNNSQLTKLYELVKIECEKILCKNLANKEKIVNNNLFS